MGELILQGGGRIGHEFLGPRDKPAVKRAQFDLKWPGRQIGERGPEALDIAVRHQEPDRVPKGEELALDLVRRPVAEE